MINDFSDYLDLYRLISGYVGLSRIISTYLKLSKVISGYLGVISGYLGIYTYPTPGIASSCTSGGCVLKAKRRKKTQKDAKRREKTRKDTRKDAKRHVANAKSRQNLNTRKDSLYLAKKMSGKRSVYL